MPTSDTAFAKVEDAFAEVLRADPDLAGYAIVTERSVDIAAEDNDYDQQIAVSTIAIDHDISDETSQTLHRATIVFEVTAKGPANGMSLGRANMVVIAEIIAALAADRTLGGRLQDWQETDTAGVSGNGKDVSAASLHVRAEFYTSRTDWFTLLGQGGATF